MTTSRKKSESALRLVVVGQGKTSGRRPHLLRLRESLIAEFNEVSDGQLYLRIEWMLRRTIDELKARPLGIEVIQVNQLEPSPHDEHLLDQRQARLARASAAKSPATKTSATKTSATKQAPRKPAPGTLAKKKTTKTKVTA